VIDYEPKRWGSILIRTAGSVGPRLLPRTIVAGLIGGLATWLYVEHGFYIPSLAHTVLGVALGLLLVFRTNASYDRYWEGRRLIGNIVNRTRDVARQLAGHVRSAEHRPIIEDVIRLLDAYFATAMQSLRSEKDLSKVTSLSDEEKKLLEPHTTARPMVVLTWVTERIYRLDRAAALGSDARVKAVEENLTALVDNYSSCERIVQTPVPFAYAHHIKMFVTLFCFTIPFAMVAEMKLYTALPSAILAYALFGIDEIGVEIEDPFGYDANDLPIEAIGEIIKKSNREILEGS
jgi:ion channel-forming bestrophin family protein